MKRRDVLALGALAVLAACTGDGPGWGDIPAGPGAEPYQGPLTAVLTDRLGGRVAERGLKVLGSRLELLPAGVTWAQHLTYRDGHAAQLHRTGDRSIPEPDAPVLETEYRGRDRTLFVIARAIDDRTRLAVLTALAEPR